MIWGVLQDHAEITANEESDQCDCLSNEEERDLTEPTKEEAADGASHIKGILKAVRDAMKPPPAPNFGSPMPPVA